MELNYEWLAYVLNWKSSKLKNAIIIIWRANYKKYIYELIKLSIIFESIKIEIWYEHIEQLLKWLG